MTTVTKSKTPTKAKVRKSEQRIQVTDAITRSLATMFDCSTQHVRNSLCFFSSSKLADDIRKKAIEMMEDVMTQNENLMNEFQ